MIQNKEVQGTDYDPEREVISKIFSAMLLRHDLLGAKKSAQYTKFKAQPQELMNANLTPNSGHKFNESLANETLVSLQRQ